MNTVMHEALRAYAEAAVEHAHTIQVLEVRRRELEQATDEVHAAERAVEDAELARRAAAVAWAEAIEAPEGSEEKHVARADWALAKWALHEETTDGGDQ